MLLPEGVALIHVAPVGQDVAKLWSPHPCPRWHILASDHFWNIPHTAVFAPHCLEPGRTAALCGLDTWKRHFSSARQELVSALGLCGQAGGHSTWGDEANSWPPSGLSFCEQSQLLRVCSEIPAALSLARGLRSDVRLCPCCWYLSSGCHRWDLMCLKADSRFSLPVAPSPHLRVLSLEQRPPFHAVL